MSSLELEISNRPRYILTLLQNVLKNDILEQGRAWPEGVFKIGT